MSQNDQIYEKKNPDKNQPQKHLVLSIMFVILWNVVERTAAMLLPSINIIIKKFLIIKTFICFMHFNIH